ncbi:hypothetical protein EP7_005651 (plasmid) [Isosphaeraceae bacterium EP7]
MANMLGRFMTGIRAGLNAFRESSFSTSRGAGGRGDFASYEARLQRYQVYWGLYENSVYRDVLNGLAPAMRSRLGLYRSIRSIYNPSYRLGEFWATHLMGGPLDTAAGDGSVTRAALPIAGASPALRLALSRLWRDSNWQTGKSIWGRYGAVMGDAPMEVHNDPAKGRVTLVPVDPRKLVDFELDRGGNVRGYTFQEDRPDPEYPGRTARYAKVVERGDGDDVLYRTTRDDAPYAWGPEGVEWVLPYGFVPFVWAQHLDVGAGAGWSELHAERGKIFEVDDQASVLNDFVRRMANAPWAFPAKQPSVGVTMPAPKSGPVSQFAATQAEGRSDPGRDQHPAIWLGEGAGTPTALVTNLNIADVVASIAGLSAEIERDFPELRFDRLRASGDASGEALRIARQPAEAKVLGRRASYDDALVRAHQMAAAIGGFEGYAGYEGFGLESYRAGTLDHSIGSRPVFGLDEADRIADEQARASALGALVSAGVPLAIAMRRTGFDDGEIAAASAEKAALNPASDSSIDAPNEVES